MTEDPPPEAVARLALAGVSLKPGLGAHWGDRYYSADGSVQVRVTHRGTTRIWAAAWGGWIAACVFTIARDERGGLWAWWLGPPSASDLGDWGSAADLGRCLADALDAWLENEKWRRER